ncbi:Protein CBG12322 [Caenorhabditis briggsae]|nr:Protein CBG12322 [Caenorhabditis briggsae]CAP31314.2 Protein CBG12322 [Caenorhabditis briggsae]
MANTVLQVDDDEYEDDFFLRNTPTSSSPSVAGSITDNEDLDFDLLGLKNRSDSSSSSSSSQSNRAGSLF